MKNPSNGFVCTCLLFFACILPGGAQEKSPDPQSAAQAVPASNAAAPSVLGTTATQTAADPATAPVDPTPATTDPQASDQNPAGQTQQPPQTPPATGQTPVPPATQPTAQDQPVQHSRIPQPPPPPPKVPDVRRPGESGFWIGVEGWFPKEHPIFNKGNNSTFTQSSRITMQGSPKWAQNIELGAAVGLHNTLKLNYTDFRAVGDFVTPVDVVALAQLYSAGTYIATNYHVQSVKLSYEYLTWPYPVGSRKFRLKTLWQVQFTQVNSTFDAPKNYFDSNGNPIVDPSTGNVINLSATQAKHIVSPMFGLGAYYYPSRHIRFEANASGFGVPHHYDIWDADASLNLRVIGHFEVRLGGRAFSFKTSTNSDYFLKGTFASAFVGVRWYSNSE